MSTSLPKCAPLAITSKAPAARAWPGAPRVRVDTRQAAAAKPERPRIKAETTEDDPRTRAKGRAGLGRPYALGLSRRPGEEGSRRKNDGDDARRAPASSLPSDCPFTSLRLADLQQAVLAYVQLVPAPVVCERPSRTKPQGTPDSKLLPGKHN